MGRRRGEVAASVGLGVLLAGCSPATPGETPRSSPVPQMSATSSPSGSAYAPVDCPDEVTIVMIVVPACGYLTVPAHHDRRNASTLRIFVIRIEPPDGVDSSDPMVAVGETLGARIEYGGLAILAQRTGRPIYMVDRRGTGLSEPELGCPEVTAAHATMLAVPSRDPRATEALTDAVRACRDRLTEAGTDLSAYGLHESAKDIEVLRTALGLEPWNVIGFGSASRLAIEVGRAESEGVRTIVLDSPVLPEGPDPMFAAGATANAIARLGQSCAADPACADAHPDVAAELARAELVLDEQPARLDVALSAHAQPIAVVVDGVRFGRAARNLLATNGGADIGMLLASLARVNDGGLSVVDPIVQSVARADPLCLGYVPNCVGIEHGSLLTTVCADILPFVDRGADLAAGEDVAGMAGLFETNPFFSACDAWDVAPDPSTSAPIETDIPVLVMAGRFDPFTGPTAEVEAAAAGRLSRGVFLEVPGHSYNVFGFNECPRTVRREWLDDPDHVPDTSCFAEIRNVRLTP
jgi:pimeloyl-ACP methyl ester carboxylesterase